MTDLEFGKRYNQQERKAEEKHEKLEKLEKMESEYRDNLVKLKDSELGKMRDEENKEFMLSSLLFLEASVGGLKEKDEDLYYESFVIHNDLLKVLMGKSGEDAKSFLKGIYNYKKESGYDGKIYNIIDNVGASTEKNVAAWADRESILLDNKTLQLAAKLSSFDALSGNHTDVASTLQN